MVIFVCLAALTLLVWRQQVDHQRSQLLRHTEDTAAQAGRRLQMFVESHIRSATIFARRWSTHETRDFSRKRFDEFASVVVEELPGYHSIGLVSSRVDSVWTVPDGAPLGRAILEPGTRGLFEREDGGQDAWLSAPFKSAEGKTGFYAVLPLKRDEERLGFLVVEFRTETLIDACFHTRVQQEFRFVVEDGDEVLFRWELKGDEGTLEASSALAKLSFPVLNRTWSLAMAPRAAVVEAVDWGASVLVLAMGLVLSLGLAWLVYLLSRRMELYRVARDRALGEVEDRQRAEAALRASVDERKRSMERLATLSRKVLMAQEQERERLSRELHDELGQLLTALRLEMGWLQKQISRGSVEIGGVFDNTISLAESATDELRRICGGLRPPLLDDLGLEPALHQLIAEFKERSIIAVDLEIRLGDENRSRIPPEVALCTYRILQESLTNVRRHSEANGVCVSLDFVDSVLKLEVTDDGFGFDPTDLGAMRGWGLEGMRERAALVGGDLEVTSASGEGARVAFRVNIEEPDEEGTT